MLGAPGAARPAVFPTRIAVISMNAIEAADALDEKQAIILSRDLSPQAAEHFFAVTEDVPGQAMETLSGEYLTKVFLGPRIRTCRNGRKRSNPMSPPFRAFSTVRTGSGAARQKVRWTF